MLKLRLNPLALQDLKEIKSYISIDLDNSIAAKRLIEKIIKRYEHLAEQPFIGALLSNIIDFNTDYRYLVVENYIIFYKVDENFVSIYRILYGSRDYMKILSDE
ncbi:MAG: type II toxin-antitoxin system RelE/ParE family toxin [Oscillospiraceae bacterium]